MNVIAGGPGDRDPLARLGGLLVSVLLAYLVSILLAALLASRVSASYGTRVAAYAILMLWAGVGAVSLFRRTARKEGTPFRLSKLPLWVISIWLWPFLLFGRKAP